MRIAPAVLGLGLLLATAACGRDPEGEGEGNNSSLAATVPEAVNESLMQDPQNHTVPLNPPPTAGAVQNQAVPSGTRQP